MVLGPIIDRSIVLLSQYQPALYLRQISNPANFNIPARSHCTKLLVCTFSWKRSVNWTYKMEINAACRL